MTPMRLLLATTVLALVCLVAPGSAAHKNKTVVAANIGNWQRVSNGNARGEQARSRGGAILHATATRAGGASTVYILGGGDVSWTEPDSELAILHPYTGAWVNRPYTPRSRTQPTRHLRPPRPRLSRYPPAHCDTASNAAYMYGGAAWFPAPEERNTRGDDPKQRRIACPVAELWEVNATTWQVTLLFNATDDDSGGSACQLRDPATALTSPGPRLGGVIMRSRDLLVLAGGWVCEAPDMPTRGLRACDEDDGQYWREMRDIWMYDIAQASWRLVAADMPGARVRFGWAPRHIAADTSRYEGDYVTHFTTSNVDPVPLVCLVTRHGREPSLWLACTRPFGEAVDDRVTINIGAPETPVPVKLVTGAISHGHACIWVIHVNGQAHVACVDITAMVVDGTPAAAENATAEAAYVNWSPIAGTDSDVSSEWIAWARPVQNRTTTYLSAWVADPDTMEVWRSDVEMQVVAADAVIVDQQQPSPVESPVEEPQQPPETIPDAPSQEEPVEEEEEEETAVPVSGDDDDNDAPVQPPVQVYEEPVDHDEGAPVSADGWVDEEEEEEEEEESTDPPSTTTEGQADASVYDYFNPPVNMEGVVKPSVYTGQQGTAVRAKPVGALSTPADVARTTTFLAVSLSAYGLVFVIVVVALVWATCVSTRNPESSSVLSRKRL